VLQSNKESSLLAGKYLLTAIGLLLFFFSVVRVVHAARFTNTTRVQFSEEEVTFELRYISDSEQKYLKY